MLTLKVQKNSAAAELYFEEHLSADEYHSEDGKSPGVIRGKLAEHLGLKAGATITPEQFGQLVQGINPKTGKGLTLRKNASGERRIFFDSVFSAPKSVSVMALTFGDKRLFAAHRTAVDKTLEEMEKFSQTRVRKGGVYEIRRTGSIVAACFDHTTSRLNDPQLHTHATVFNATFDQVENRIKALECYSIYDRATYLTEIYRYALANEVRSLGYEIQTAEHGFELKCVPLEVLQLFSKRSQSIKAAELERKNELGRELTNDELAALAHRSRPKKDPTLTEKVIQAMQLAEVDEKTKQKLFAAIEHARSTPPPPLFTRADITIKAADAVQKAVMHMFERQSVVKGHELMTAALKFGQREIGPDDLQKTLHLRKDLLFSGEKVAHKEHLKLEMEMIEKFKTGIGSAAKLLESSPQSDGLRIDQELALKKMAASQDRYQILRGKAGSGKSHTLKLLVNDIKGSGIKVMAVAPTTGATRNLATDIKCETMTVQGFIKRKHEQSKAQEGLLIVDEAGLLSIKQMTEIFEASEREDFRVLLVGDTRQHLGVEAGDALRILERFAATDVSELYEIKRQDPERFKSDLEKAKKVALYRDAMFDLAAGEAKAGLTKLKTLGAFTELQNDNALREALALKYVDHLKQNHDVMIVAPRWVQITQISDVVRLQLKQENMIGMEGIKKDALSSVSFTEAEKLTLSSYVAATVTDKPHHLIFHDDVGEYKENGVWKIISVEKDHMRITDGREEKAFTPTTETVEKFSVAAPTELEIVPGEKILIQRNLKLSTTEIPNGTVVEVAEVFKNKSFRLKTGEMIPADFKYMSYGYAFTSHASQGKTADHVLVEVKAQSGRAANANQFYVSCSRGRESVNIFTDDIDFISGRVIETSNRESVLELLHANLRSSQANSLSNEIEKSQFKRPEEAEKCFDAESKERRKKEAELLREAVSFLNENPIKVSDQSFTSEALKTSQEREQEQKKELEIKAEEEASAARIYKAKKENELTNLKPPTSSELIFVKKRLHEIEAEQIFEKFLKRPQKDQMFQARTRQLEQIYKHAKVIEREKSHTLEL